MKAIILCATLLALGGVAAASGVRTGSAFRHEDNVLRCGTPQTSITWTTGSRAEQRFQRCAIVATYATVTPTARPSVTPLPTPASRPTATPWVFPTVAVTATLTAGGGPADPIEAALFALINQTRQQAGLAPYSYSAQQSACSRAHSLHMSQAGYISHDQFPADVCVSYFAAGENVAYGGLDPLATVQATFSGMMAEGPGGGHFQNLMSTTYTHVGIGVYTDGRGLTWITEDMTA